jgi:hypothetical protein
MRYSAPLMSEMGQSLRIHPASEPIFVRCCSNRRQTRVRAVCPLSAVISTGRRNTGGRLAINNDDGLPNVRPIAFRDSPRNQLSHNTIFSAALIPLRNH